MASESPLNHPDEWSVVRLADITLKIGSGATPRGGAENYLPERIGFALIRSQNVFDRYFNYSGLAFISDAQASELQNVIVQPGDLLLNITGDGVTFSRCCVVPEDVLPACVNQHVSIIRVDPTLADHGYVLAFLTHPIVKVYIESFNAGGSRRAITKGHIESFELPLPPTKEQRSIAYILGTLDEKIELNRKMSETHEAMARALFKSWFVDFDPVRAKAEGRDTGLQDIVAALFPDSFEDSELGEVPTGWSVSSLGHFADVVDCLHAKKPERLPEGLPLLQLGNIRSDALLDMTDTYLISETDYAKWIGRMEASPGDCVITNVGRVGAVSQIPDGFKAALGRNMTGVRCCSTFPFPTYLIQALTSDFMRAEIERKTDSGTILDALNVRSIPKLRIVLPPLPILRHFERQCRPFRERMETSVKETRILTALRDSLLPKLISGEIRLGMK